MQNVASEPEARRTVFLKKELDKVLPESIRDTAESAAVLAVIRRVTSYTGASLKFIRHEVGDGMNGRIPDYSRRGYLRSVAELYRPGQEFETGFADGWTFPDGYRDPSPWLVFSRDGKTKAVAQHCIDISRRPVLTLSVLQGIPEEEVRLRDVAAQIIRSWRHLLLTDWGLRLRVSQSRSNTYHKVRDLFFHRLPSYETFPGFPSYHQLNVKKRATKRALGIE